VLQVSTADIGGGAEKVALDLHRAYRELGIDASLAVGYRRTLDERVLQIPNEERRSGWARRLEYAASQVAGTQPTGVRRAFSRGLLLAAEPRRYRAIARGIEDFCFPGTSELPALMGRRPDVLHLHNLHGYYFDLRRMPGISHHQPTILTMHDPWLLTGHCAHPIDCQNWRTGCGDCPDLGRYVPIRKDASAENFNIKRSILGSSALHLAAPSHWLAKMTEESGVSGELNAVRVIPNGIDTQVFSPGNREESREILGLPKDALIVLFAAQGITTNPFKDYATLVAALRRVSANAAGKVLLVALGDEGAVAEGLDVRGVPFTEDARSVAHFYRAADLYVHAARAENLPLAVIEAMACGTPIVASAVGGIPEIVVEGETGLLVRPNDAPALAEAIGTVLADSDLRRAFVQAGLERVAARFTLRRQVDSYLNWYAELVARS
jgi:glycosyltransferase involved in cell wall biosynthesis